MIYCGNCGAPLVYNTDNHVDGDIVFCACGGLVVVCVSDKVEYATFVCDGENCIEKEQ